MAFTEPVLKIRKPDTKITSKNLKSSSTWKLKKPPTFFLFWNVKEKVNGSAKFLQNQIFEGLHY